MSDKFSIVEYQLTDHAKAEMVRRQISETEVSQVLSAPEQSELVRTGRRIFQSLITQGEPPGIYLLRVFVDVDHKPPMVVTVYRTSKLGKYWRPTP